MRTPSNLNRGDVGFNMTPMIDIVFLLIIFFLVSSHLARQEVQVEMDLPTAKSGLREEEDDTRRVTVNVRPDGQILLGGRSLSADELAQVIGHERQSVSGPLEVRIRADQNVPYRIVEPIMLACVRGQVWNVTFAVVRGND